MAILDPDKLELWTFYKKVDIMKDQDKLILGKFGAVREQFNCVITNKNAIRVIDLRMPDNARTFRLFSAAILSSIQLQGLGDRKAIKVNQEIWLVQSSEGAADDWSPATRNCARWNLERTDLQVIGTGQLLLAVRPSLWPSVFAMTDLIDPDVWPLDSSRSTTLYLLPTGQLARYCGNWITGTRFTLETKPDRTYEEREASEYQQHWIQKVTFWLETRSSLKMDAGTIWLEAEIPVLPEDGLDARSQTLEWKRIYWPAALSYAFEQSTEDSLTEQSDTEDPLLAAVQWASSGAAAAQSSKPVDFTSFHPAFDSDDHRLFEEDTQFDSPQHFMSIPMQTFAQSQMIYPTPPDGPNAQPTPGMSVDGMVQTPATISQMMGSNINSSPVTTTAHEMQAPATAQVVANFLNHDADDVDDTDDLFDDMEYDKLRHASFDHEPNWDYFNSEGLTTDPKSKSAESGADDVEALLVDEKVNPEPPLETEPDSPEASPKHVIEEKDFVERYETQQDKEDDVVPAETTTTSDPETDRTIVHDITASPTGMELGEPSSQPVTDTATSKRRRSSAYEVVLPLETQRDLRYSKDGKYWFEPKKPYLNKTKSLPPVPLYKPASPSSEGSESSDDSMNDTRTQQLISNTHPWIEYTPIAPDREPERTQTEDSNTLDGDVDIEALIEIIESATGREPFVTSMPTLHPRRATMDSDIEDSSLSLQWLAEQIASSSLLRNHSSLSLPRNCHTSTTEVTIENTGSSVTIPSTSLGNLTILSPQLSQSKAGRLHSLPHGKICLSQADSKIAADVSILNFWETLNLQPSSGPKKTQALCVYPKSDSLQRGARLFLQRMSETWVSCNLGYQQPAILDDMTTDGSIAWDPDNELAQLCHGIGVALGKAASELCTVLYLVIPRDDLRECAQLCDCFYELFQAMADHRLSTAGDIVLQLVPSSLLMDVDTIAVPPEEQLITLALELYQRLPPTVPAESSFLAPAMTLSEPMSSGPLFELNADNASPLARYGQSCHLAYYISLDSRWLVASWSDSLGEMASSVAYRLLDAEGDLAHSRLEIFQHICQVSAAIMSRQKQKWWFIIAKVGMFEVAEFQDWSVATSHLTRDQKSLSRIALVSVDMQPRITLRNNTGIKPVALASQLQNTLSTPVSTPQAASTTSPEQATPITPTAAPMTGFNAPTPPDYNAELSNETDIYVTDTMDDCWIIMLSFGLNQSREFLEVRPALASGFLAKRASGQRPSDPMLSLLGVNLMYVPRKTGSSAAPTLAEREQVLEEIIAQYRGLHLLALAKRIVDPTDSPIPCHIASAYRTATFLQQFT